MVPTVWYVVLSAVLFTVGVIGVLVRRNAIVVFMCVELMLSSANVALAAFSRQHALVDGQVMVFFVIAVAAAEVAVGLALLVMIFRAKRSSNVDDVRSLKG